VEHTEERREPQTAAERRKPIWCRNLINYANYT
jgi:hypothetical protein